MQHQHPEISIRIPEDILALLNRAVEVSDLNRSHQISLTS